MHLKLENLNSLCLYDDTKTYRKSTRVCQINHRYQTDGALLVECGTDFRKVPEEKKLDILLGDAECRYVTANNVTEPSGKSQYGGVAAFAYPRLAGFPVWAAGPGSWLAHAID